MTSEIVGLKTLEVAALQKKFGLNILPEKPAPSRLSIFFQQLKSPLVYVLLVASIITLAIGDYSDAIIIFLAVFINTILGFVQEYRASNALNALKHYMSDNTVVIRDGKRVTIETSQIVVGDTVILEPGSKVPADGKLISCNRLFIDEAILTGESIPANKNVDSLAYSGTTVSSGQGTMVVEAISSHTKIGAIAKEIQTAEEDTPLQKQLKVFSRQLVIAVTVVTIFVFILGIAYQYDLSEIFITAVALAVSSIPEGLLVSLTVILAIGMQKILKQRGLVRKISAAETLGGITVVCVDKTGTLTQGKTKLIDYIGDKNDLALQSLLANDLDDPMIVSAFEWGRSVIADSVKKYQRLDSIPFLSKERHFISLSSWNTKSNMVFVNGAPELVLEWTTLSKKEKEQVVSQINELTKQGKRIIGMARKEVPHSKKTLVPTDAKKGLTWVGLLTFSDPVRLGVREALLETVNAGIRTIVITGDYAQTTIYVLHQLGINVKEEEIITGDELKSLSLSQLAIKVKSIKLFARTTPDQKLRIVQALKKNGEIVAMMGDGVNDAPALHDADIGVVVSDATDVAKESADIVLLDSNFSTVVKAIEEGRTMFENIRKVILYLMCDSFSEILIVVGSIALGLPLPITATMILWINIVSDGFPNLALTLEPKRSDMMKENPRSPKEKLVNGWMLGLIGVVSLVTGIITLTTFILVYRSTGDLALARSMTFVTLGLDSLIYVFSVRNLMSSFWNNNPFSNKWLNVAIVFGFALQILPFSTPWLRQFFGLVELPMHYWVVAFGLAVFVFALIELLKLVHISSFKESNINNNQNVAASVK